MKKDVIKSIFKQTPKSPTDLVRHMREILVFVHTNTEACESKREEKVQLGVNMPAQAIRKLVEDKVEASEVELFEVYDVVLYMGIIDIFQEYNLRKKLEHAYKSMQFDPVTISVVEPELYAQRFINFLETKVFPENP